MRFEWDEKKRLKNLDKHELDFADVEKVFEGHVVEFPDDREDYGEDRFLTLGLLGDYVVVIVNVLEEDTIRIISMRKADTDEQELYYSEISY